MAAFTEAAIKETFLKLLSERPYSSITVKEIAAECGINRNTFYYHFQDIPSLMEETIRDECDRVISAYPSLNSIEECLHVAVEFVSQNKAAALHIYHSVDRSIYERHLWRVSDYVVRTYMETVLADVTVPEEDKEVILRYYKCTVFGHVTEWLEQEMRDDINTYIKRICALKQGQIEEMLQRICE